MYSIWLNKIDPTARLSSALRSASTLSRFIPRNRRTGTQSDLDLVLDVLDVLFSRRSELLHIEGAMACNEQVVNIDSHVAYDPMFVQLSCPRITSKRVIKGPKGGIQVYSATAPSTMTQRVG